MSVLDPAVLRIGAICSAGASAIRAAHALFQRKGIELRVVTHRPSGIEEFCTSSAIPHIRIEEMDKEKFSLKARDWLVSQDIDFTILFLDRILSRAFVETMFTVNFHPSLLPAFAGTHAVERTLAANAPYLGATAHQATEGVDEGPIIAQSAYPLATSDRTLERMNDLSFVQRLALLCNVADSQIANRKPGDRGWISPSTARQRATAFLSPSWLEDDSEALVNEHATRRNMLIALQ